MKTRSEAFFSVLRELGDGLNDAETNAGEAWREHLEQRE
jgi:predicted RNase H-like HicB family nuclease